MGGLFKHTHHSINLLHTPHSTPPPPPPLLCPVFGSPVGVSMVAACALSPDLQGAPERILLQCRGRGDRVSATPSHPDPWDSLRRFSSLNNPPFRSPPVLPCPEWPPLGSSTIHLHFGIQVRSTVEHYGARHPDIH